MSDDAELLNRYAGERSEAAFVELTRRYVDLVYSAALRVVDGDVYSAQDVTQQVFTELARQAARLTRHPALVGWLYTTTRLMALRFNRTEQRRKAREQEANSMNELLHDDSPPLDWTRLGPVIEEAMHELDEKDRHAVLLRYFQNKTLNEVGADLDLTGNAARMRVDRALDKLRGILARRGITTSASALAAVVSANAVQAAPAGFATAVSAAAIAGSAVQVSAVVAATQTIAMTTLQKTIIATALTAAVGTGIFAVRQSSQLHQQIQTLEQRQAPLAAHVQQLEQERDRATNQLAALNAENARLRSSQDRRELLRLRGEVGVLQQQAAMSQAKTDAPTSGLAKMLSDPTMKEYLRQAQMDKIRSLYADFFKEQKLTPEQTDKLLELLSDAASRSLDQYLGTAQGTPNQASAEASGDVAGRLRALLGDEGCARFKEYSDEIPARTTVKLLQTQLGENALNEAQSSRLMHIVEAEPNELTQGITGAPDKAFLGSQADIDNFLYQVEESNRRVLQQAGSFLSPAQLAALNTVLTNAVNTRQLQAAALIQKH